MATKRVRDLIRETIEYCEDAYWAKEANEREANFSKESALTHR